MRKNIYLLSLLLGIAFIFTSCDNAMKDNFPEEFASVVYFKMPIGEQEQTVKLSNTGELGSYTIMIGKGGNTPSSVAKAKISVLSQAEMEAYNNERGTAYRLLPAKYYTLLANEVYFKSEEFTKEVDISIKTSEIVDELEDECQYVLPLQLIAQEGTTNSKLNLIVLKLVVATPKLTVDLPAEQKILMSLYDDITTRTINVPLYIDLNDNKWEFSAIFEKSETELQKAVDSYNLTHPMLTCALLPQANYNFPNQADFTIGSPLSLIDIKIDRTGLTAGNYLLPVMLKECIGRPFNVNKTPSYIILMIQDELPSILLKASMLKAASQQVGYIIQNITDKSATTWWETEWNYPGGNETRPNHPTYGLYFDVTLETAIKSFSFSYQTRLDNSLGSPAALQVYVGSNETDLTLIADLNSNDLPPGTGEWFKSIGYTSLKKITFMRFAIIKTQQGRDMRVKQPGNVWIAEFELYGK